MRDRHALVAYEQANSTYDIHRSHRLSRDLQDAWRITEVTPYGYSRDDVAKDLVNPEPLERIRSVQEIVDRLDFTAVGAIIVVSDTFDVTPYRSLWFGFENCCASVADSERIGHGAIASLPGMQRDPEIDATFCARVVAVKGTLGGLVDDGQLSLVDAHRHLRTHVSLLEADGHDVVFGTTVNPGEVERPHQSAAASIIDRILGWP